MLHACEPGGRDCQGHRDALPDHVADSRAVFHVDQDTLAQFDFLKIAFVRPICAFCP